MKKVLLLILIWGAFGWFFANCVRYYRADIYYDKANTALELKKTKEAFGYAQKAIQLNPLEPNYFRARARVLLVMSLVSDEQQVLSMKSQAVEDLEKSAELNPHNLVTLRNVAPLYYFIALDYNSISNDRPVFLEPYYTKSKEVLKNLKTEYSHDAGVLTVVANEEAKYGLAQEYYESVDLIKKLRPDLLEWHEAFEVYRLLRDEK